MPKIEYAVEAIVSHRVIAYVKAESDAEARDLVIGGNYEDEYIIEYYATEEVLGSEPLDDDE